MKTLLAMRDVGLTTLATSLLAEVLFLVFADGRKETSAMSRKRL